MFLNEAVEQNCEGLMVKTLDSNATYLPSRRSLNWLKLKKDYMDGLTDSFDLVPIGAWHGKGKRSGTYGAYLLACYSQEDESFQSVTKVGTGFSDEQLQEFTKYFNENELIRPKKPMGIDSNLEPEVWFEPKAVWEIKAADLSISPVHRAAVGIVHSSKGIALRFPRLLRVRDDKAAEAATSAEQVATMYRDQPQIRNAAKGGAGAAVDDWD